MFMKRTRPVEHPRVRAQYTCIRCGGSKGLELLLCWPCHHAEKELSDGGYSDEIEQSLAKFERWLCQEG
jgi:hypothetical protein